MGWVSCKERLPDRSGDYQVIIGNPGVIPSNSLFTGVSPFRYVGRLSFKECLELEADYADRVVYVKTKCFHDVHESKVGYDKVLYWYELDPMPEPCLNMCD